MDNDIDKGKYISVIGIGYVGMGNALVLGDYNTVTMVDTDIQKVISVNAGISPVNVDGEDKYQIDRELNITATTVLEDVIMFSDYAIICVPTDYNEVTNYFNTSIVDSVIKSILKYNQTVTIVVKSTIPIGYIDYIVRETGYKNIVFSPEFLREDSIYHDSLHPSRTIVGGMDKELCSQVAGLYKETTYTEEVILTGSKEAESIKLFSNTYLAMRVAYFNELDTYANEHNLNTKDIIDGVSADIRIGKHYNNPSFGYGGYCLPKDTKQLLANYDGISSDIINAIVKSNTTRIEYIVHDIIKNKPKSVGIHRLAMKHGSDNFRVSSIISVMELLSIHGVDIEIYEPGITDAIYHGHIVNNDFKTFVNNADIIISNRMYPELDHVASKVYTRDVYGDN